MVGLDDVRYPGGDRERPGPAADPVVEDRREHEVEQRLRAVVADAVDQLAGGAGLAGQPGEIAVGAVEDVPHHVQAEP